MYPLPNCRICGHNVLEKIFSLDNYPVFIGCTDEKKQDDVLYKFEIWHCPKCDVGQQLSIPPFDVLYKEQRCFGYGKVWAGHYDQYFEFIKKNSSDTDKALEVGVGNAVVYKKMLKHSKSLYGIDAIHNEDYAGYNIKVDKFSETVFSGETFNLIYSSHLIEHMPDPVGYLRTCYNLLEKNGLCFAACPNIIKSFENLHFNAFTTDHLNYFSKESLANLAADQGFQLVDFFQYMDHGMYLALRKINDRGKKTNEYRKSFMHHFNEYYKKLEQFVEKVKEEAKNSDSIYLFGAHGLSVTFLKLMNSPTFNSKVKFVLDNERTKHNRRLSGTDLICKPPAVIQDQISPLVILYMGAYENEISEQLKTLNPSCKIIRSRDFVS